MDKIKFVSWGSLDQLLNAANKDLDIDLDLELEDQVQERQVKTVQSEEDIRQLFLSSEVKESRTRI